ncbi:MAG: right-handed parallel beta-helix repeat-containing protein, partial [Muribaculaceae bacterium]|nr:right-handed parallel beta-helix repeat-containing protein [Muribaculaceae bacterium]
VLDRDTHFTADRPYQIRDSLVVLPGVTMTVDPGATLYFHDKAELLVYGSLQANGTSDLPISMIGDRTGNVAASIPFELMSGQWGGVYFAPSSHDNLLRHTSLRNSSYGVAVDSITSTLDRPALRIINSQIRNSSGYTFQAAHSAIEIIGTEITDASQGILYMRGGQLRLNHCTLANYYLFTALGGPALQLAHVNADDDDQSGLPYIQADITNTIIYGNGKDLSHGDLTGTAVTLRNCIFKSSGSDDDNFINCLWDTDPLYYTVREDYLFDYRVKPESQAIGAGDASLTLPEAAIDRLGRQRTNPPTIGCYEYQPE